MAKRVAHLSDAITVMHTENLTPEDLRLRCRILDYVQQLQQFFIQHGAGQQLFDQLLLALLDITDSQYGFLGEVLSDVNGKPYLRTFSIASKDNDAAIEKYFQAHAPAGLEFTNMDTLFGHVITTKRPLITNTPFSHPASGGIPKGHPALNNFFGIPILLEGKIIAMAGLANSPNGYDEAIYQLLSPLLASYGTLIQGAQKEEDRQRLEHRLGHARKMETVGHITGGVAHDFNNIFAALMNNLELIIDDPDHQDTMLRVTQCLKAASSGSRMINQLLSYTRQQAINTDKHNLSLLTQKTLSESRALLGNKISLEFDAGVCQSVELTIDQRLYRSALKNLIINAIEAIPLEGRILVSLKCKHIPAHIDHDGSELAGGHYFIVSVRDTGKGMDFDTSQNAFDPFFTTKDVGQGSGLGLSMTYGFAKQYGGKVSLISEPHKGTTASIYLPLNR